MKIMKVLMLTLVMAIMASTAQAATVFIDFDGSDAPIPDTNGRYWNGADADATGSVVTDAVDQDNVATNVDINVTNAFEGIASFGIASTITDWDLAVTNDSAFITGANTAAFDIEGLVANGHYDLTFYGSRSGNGFRQTDVTIGATTQSYSWGSPTENGEALTTFTSVAANGSGEITVDIGIGVGAGILAALQIDGEFIPEPSSVILLGISGLVGLAIRRRRE